MFAIIGTLFYTLVAILLFRSDSLTISLEQLTVLLICFAAGNIVFSGLFFVPFSEAFKYKCLVVSHTMWGQLGLVILASVSPGAIEISLMMSLATFAFVVFGIPSLKLIPLVALSVIGFGSVIFSETANISFIKSSLMMLSYVVSSIFIIVINSYVGNLQLFLSKQNQLIKSQSDELKQAHAKVIKAKEDAEESSHSKSRFLAAASHDLRQPIYALELYIGALDTQDGQAKAHIISQMKKSAYELRELLNYLFDISKYDTGVSEVNLRQVKLDQIIEDLELEFKDLSEKEGRPLTVRSSNAIVETDPVLMHRIIRGLVTNALRHAKKGRVLLGFRHKKHSVRCEVWDSGVGISASELDKVFEEFYQVENQNRDRSKGLGLGLALIKRMCEALGHAIEVHSIEGKGTCFSVEMKKASGEEPFAWEQPIVDLYKTERKEMILCIDDEEDILRGLSVLLNGWGYQVMAASGPDQAIGKLLDANKKPSVILCDYRLADDVNGIDALNYVNQSLEENIPSIIVTGDLDKEIEKRANQFSYKVLLKPVSPAKLKLYLQRLIASTYAES